MSQHNRDDAIYHAELSQTKRPTSPYMESILYQQFPILDHGFIQLVDYLGDELSVVNAARISYNTEHSELKPSDVGLLRYLMRMRHSTPYESCVIKFRAKMPIFVARQWIRHRTASVNEQSARYSILDNEFYIPSEENIQPQSTDNKQGRAGELTIEQKHLVQKLLRQDAWRAYNNYEILLAEEADHGGETKSVNFPEYILHGDSEFPGIARELARMNLSLNFYTSWIWQTNLHNLLHFLGLRADPHAQYEIRIYANKILEIVQGWLPNVCQAFMDYQMNAITLSGPEWQILQPYLQDTPQGIAQAFSECQQMSKREKQDLFYKIFGTKEKF